MTNYFSLRHLYILFFSISFTFGFSQNKSQISGQIHLNPDTWDPLIYLSYIPSFDDMYTMSSGMIISATEIDSTGHFSFDTSFLPEDNNVYRIHISKKNAPPMSLIIGSEDENHVFFVANNSSNINIRNENVYSLFINAQFYNDSVNTDFQKVTNIIKNEENIDINATLMQRNLIRASTQNQLSSIVKENSHPLVALYALYNSDVDINNTKDQKFIERFNTKWKSENNTYFEAYRTKYFINTSNYFYAVFISIGLFLLVLGYILNRFYKRKQTTNNEKQLQSLSIQERKILHLIRQGLSNKEISEECHIGLSTVKSHVSSIYSKLNVKSRKDVLKEVL